MSAREFAAARAELGLSAAVLARGLGVAEARTVYGWETGRSAVPGPVAVLVRLALADERVSALVFGHTSAPAEP